MHAAAGFGFGLFVLHPVSMAVLAWLGAHSDSGLLPLGADLVWSSFTVGIFPMGVVFGLFSMVIGAMDGYYRSTVHFQRDQLARQLALNEEFRRELEAQNKRLRELEAAKRRSTHFLVHDLKNHLACVLGFTELLHGRAQVEHRDDDREDLERVLRQARQMMGEVLDLLDLARMEEAPSLDPDWQDIEAMLEEALDNVDVPGVSRQVRTGTRHLECPSVWCDRRLIVRVLVNLSTNALKHNPRGVEVTLDAEPLGSEALFSCSDDGPGIPAALVPSLFDEFVTESTQAAGYGFGLGLAFCKAAVEAHGGRIWCESDSARGTTFQFALPLGTETARPVSRPNLEAESTCVSYDGP